MDYESRVWFMALWLCMMYLTIAGLLIYVIIYGGILR